jgi:hypothetical protein
MLHSRSGIVERRDNQRTTFRSATSVRPATHDRVIPKCTLYTARYCAPANAHHEEGDFGMKLWVLDGIVLTVAIGTVIALWLMR